MKLYHLKTLSQKSKVRKNEKSKLDLKDFLCTVKQTNICAMKSRKEVKKEVGRGREGKREGKRKGGMGDSRKKGRHAAGRLT